MFYKRCTEKKSVLYASTGLVRPTFSTRWENSRSCPPRLHLSLIVMWSTSKTNSHFASPPSSCPILHVFFKNPFQKVQSWIIEMIFGFWRLCTLKNAEARNRLTARWSGPRSGAVSFNPPPRGHFLVQQFVMGRGDFRLFICSRLRHS